MMTVIHRGRRARRYETRRSPAPTWEPFLIQEWDRRIRGEAKPGRGGRRRRKVDRAKIRARIGRGVERKGWPLSWALRRWMVIKGPTRTFTEREIDALAATPFFVLPAGYEFQILEPKILGRRERRRRAKLRRRRARAEREGRQPAPISTSGWCGPTLARTCAILGQSRESPIPGA